MLRKKFFALAIFSVVLMGPCLLEGAEAEGNVAITEGGTALNVKFKMSGSDNGISGDGFLQCIEDGAEKHISISYVQIDGKYAWFAGECTSDGVDSIGNWFFGVVHDGGKPGRLVDQIWWEWIPDSEQAESEAKSKVQNLEIPSDNKEIKSGDINVSS